MKNIKPVSYAELKKKLDNATKSDLYFYLEEIKDGKYVLPLELLKILIHDSGLITHMGWKKASDDSAGAVESSVGPSSSGEVWLVHMILATYKCDATVIDRVLKIAYQPGPYGVLSALPTSFITMSGPTLSASQQGGVLMVGKNFNYLNDNGTVTQSTSDSESVLPLPLYGDSALISTQTTNKQATDLSGIDVLYEIVGKES